MTSRNQDDHVVHNTTTTTTTTTTDPDINRANPEASSAPTIVTPTAALPHHHLWMQHEQQQRQLYEYFCCYGPSIDYFQGIMAPFDSYANNNNNNKSSHHQQYYDDRAPQLNPTGSFDNSTSSATTSVRRSTSGAGISFSLEPSPVAARAAAAATAAGAGGRPPHPHQGWYPNPNYHYPHPQQQSLYYYPQEPMYHKAEAEEGYEMALDDDADAGVGEEVESQIEQEAEPGGHEASTPLRSNRSSELLGEDEDAATKEEEEDNDVVYSKENQQDTNSKVKKANKEGDEEETRVQPPPTATTWDRPDYRQYYEGSHPFYHPAARSGDHHHHPHYHQQYHQHQPRYYHSFDEGEEYYDQGYGYGHHQGHAPADPRDYHNYQKKEDEQQKLHPYELGSEIEVPPPPPPPPPTYHGHYHHHPQEQDWSNSYFYSPKYGDDSDGHDGLSAFTTPSPKAPLARSTPRHVTPGTHGAKFEFKDGHPDNEYEYGSVYRPSNLGLGFSSAVGCDEGGGVSKNKASDSATVTPSQPTRRTRMAQPGELVTLESYDIVCGRGAPTNFHPGNDQFRELCSHYQSAYFCAKRSDKPHISMKILDTLQERGTRFVRRQKGTKGHSSTWVVVSQKLAYEKVCQQLRDGAPQVQHSMLFSQDKIREAVQQQSGKTELSEKEN